MQKQREKESERPPAKQPPKKIPQLPKAKPDRDGKGDKPQDFKSMTEYARHVMEKKQREMEQEEKRKLAEDPDYVPKKPLSPTMPKNMPKSSHYRLAVLQRDVNIEMFAAAFERYTSTGRYGHGS